MALRMQCDWRALKKEPCQAPFNTFIYGAGRMGVETAKRLQFDPQINLVGFVDDNQALKDRFVLGLRVVGTGKDLPYLKELYLAKCAVIAFQPHSAAELETAQRNCLVARIPEIRLVSSHNGIAAQTQIHNGLRKFRFSDELGMANVPLMSEVSELLEGGVASIIGADHLGEHLCHELGRSGVQKIVLVDSCRARLRLADRLRESSRAMPEIVAWYQPWGMEAETEKIFEEHNVSWVFCNHLNRGVPRASLNECELFLDFIETVRYVSMTLRSRCDGFTLISPRRSDRFCEEEQSYHHLCEQYVRFAAQDVTSVVRSGTVQIPNLLEDDGGIVNGMLQHISVDPLFSVPEDPMRFSSARYAARTILNSLPMHGLGETYVQFPAHVLSLRMLIDLYRQNHQAGVEHRVIGHDKGPTVCDAAHVSELGDLSDSAKTNVGHLRIVTNPGLPDLRRCEQGLELYREYMTRQDLEAVQAYISDLSHRSSPIPGYRGQSSNRWASSA